MKILKYMKDATVSLTRLTVAFGGGFAALKLLYLVVLYIWDYSVSYWEMIHLGGIIVFSVLVETFLTRYYDCDCTEDADDDDESGADPEDDDPSDGSEYLLEPKSRHDNEIKISGNN